MKTRWIQKLLALTLVLALAIPFVAFAEEEAVLADVEGSQIVEVDPVDSADIGESELELASEDETLDESEGEYIVTQTYNANPNAPSSVYIDRTQGVDFWVGIGSTQLNAVLTPNTASTSLKWKSSNKKVVKVSAGGVITPIKAGKAKITVTTGNKKKASINVRIHKNILNNIQTKPSKSYVKSMGRGFDFRVKSVERTAGGKYVASFYLLNNLGKSKKLTNFGVKFYIDGSEVASKYVSKINISSSKGSAKVFKVTFSGAEISDKTPRLLNTLEASQILFELTTTPRLYYYL